ncbi:hypothetical protein HCCG_01628 [Helicobacter cinaedi CCUG 18818 = ATCC BAA-847]|uniref:Uncharacterized protein n=1 Tax=Helicobacter cinaedi CCUG 18818 = ATCC BAA-847 TaxID=537971 RepID=A0ABN0BBY7_9HELI|nr:hypothetical protein HCCG_01628 [Helicobacter cinaedi CCUG 18818 = ATCC BAA-847]BBB19390.1 hypothetical protein HC081234_05670 [Helicobacter cinaedi]
MESNASFQKNLYISPKNPHTATKSIFFCILIIPPPQHIFLLNHFRNLLSLKPSNFYHTLTI